MTSTKPAIQSTSRYREAALRILGDGNPGDVLSVDDLKTGMDAHALDHRRFVAHVRRARLTLERRSQRWWRWAEDFKSLVCIDEKTANAAMFDEKRKIERTAVKTIRRASCIDPTKMDGDNRRQFDLSLAQAQMARMSVSRKMGTALEKKGTFDPPKIGQVAKLFQKKA